MKSGLIIVLVILGLVVVSGAYFYLSQPSYSGNNGAVCAADVKQCPDGSYVTRMASLNCKFASCPETGTNNQTNNSSITQPQTINAEIKSFAFMPETLEINVGDTVVWTNKDSTSHTVTSDSGGELNSDTLSGASGDGYYSSPTSGEKYTHTFTTEGTYNYHCSFHSGMKGKVIVR